MEDATMRQRVRAARVARLATVTPTGRPHVVPCCFTLEGDVVYSVVDSKPKSTTNLQRLENIRAHGEAALLVDHYDEDWTALWWIRVDGNARVVEAGDEHDHAVRVLREKYDQYQSMPLSGAVIAIDARRWRAWP
jgi:PPOX class probable F420-dependent enzyme